jgi:glyoxylase I family protein
MEGTSTLAGTRSERPAFAVRGLHHHAYRARDMEATRAFYEDVIGLPLIATFVETRQDGTAPASYIHTFFELQDGSCLAFFGFPGEVEGQLTPVNSFGHHLALEVEGLAAIEAIRKRYEAYGLKSRTVDHGYCVSIYTQDPNGMTIEFTTKVPATDAIMAERRPTAHEDLRKWLAGIVENNNRWRGSSG